MTLIAEDNDQQSFFSLRLLQTSLLMHVFRSVIGILNIKCEL